MSVKSASRFINKMAYNDVKKHEEFDFKVLAVHETMDIFRSKFEQIFLINIFSLVNHNELSKPFVVVNRVDPAMFDKSMPAPIGFLAP